MLIVYLASLALSSCATTAGSGKSGTSQVTGKNNTNSSLSYGTDNGIYGQSSTGKSATAGKGIDFLAFKLPFDLSTINLDNLSQKEKNMVAGFFGLSIAGAYTGMVITKIFIKRK